MKYENLDYDTRNIIETMCKNTGKTKEQAILALLLTNGIGLYLDLTNYYILWL